MQDEDKASVDAGKIAELGQLTKVNAKETNNSDSSLRMSSYVEDSIVDGPGLRMAIYTQGCVHNCAGCHNPHTHDIRGGSVVNVDKLLEIIFLNPLCSGVTFSGGEPLLQSCPLAIIARECKSRGLGVWLYTGFTWDQVLNMSCKNDCIAELLKNCDVLVDGKFQIEKRDLTLYCRGSSNQRLIDVQKSLTIKNEIILHEPPIGYE